MKNKAEQKEIIKLFFVINLHIVKIKILKMKSSKSLAILKNTKLLKDNL